MTEDIDLLGGDPAADLLAGTPTPAKKKTTKKKAAKAPPTVTLPAAKKTKKSVAAKAPTGNTAATETRSAVKKAPSKKKVAAGRAPIEDKHKVFLHDKPKLDDKALGVIAALALTDGEGITSDKLMKKVFGSKGTPEDLKPLLASLRAKKIITVTEGVVTFNVETLGGNLNSPHLVKLFKTLPTDAGKGLSAGVIGGEVYGEDKEDKWLNVRYGRATGRLLHKLLEIGAVGRIQYRDDKGTIQWYRLGKGQ